MCLEDSLTIMIQTLKLIYMPDIEPESKINIMNYLRFLYFGDERLEIYSCQEQKDFVYNAVKNFAEMN